MTYITNSRFVSSTQHPSIIARVKTALARRKQRNILYSLTYEQLADIGLTRRDVQQEYAKSVWADII